MTTCHRKHLESLCRQRGYSLASVMPCVVAQDGDQWTIDTEHPAYPKKRQKSAWKPVPIGDLVETWLTRVGITADRVESLTGTAGKPGGCGCKKRKKWLNEVGNQVQIAAHDGLVKAHKFYFGET